MKKRDVEQGVCSACNFAYYKRHKIGWAPCEPPHAAAWQGRIYGCQFHPEKSGAAGLAMLARFIGLGSA